MNRPIGAGLAGLAMTVLLAVPGAAGAATSVRIGSDGQLRIEGDSFANAIEVRRVGAGFDVTDSLARLELGSRCVATSPPHAAFCPAAAEAPVRIDGNAGADDLTLIGDTGEALLIGDAGGDRLTGGPANDILDAGLGDDVVLGSGGFDLLDGGAGGDELRGGSGRDTVSYSDGHATGVRVTLPVDAGDRRSDDGSSADGLGAGSRDTVFEDVENVAGGTGDDEITGNDADNLLRGDKGADALFGRGGDDTLDGEQGPDTLTGNDGRDLADYTRRTAGVRVTLDGEADDGDAGDLLDGRGDDVRSDVERVETGPGNDVLVGSNGDNRFKSADGNDTLEGRGGADDLQSGSGSDHLEGGSGPDFVSGGESSDAVTFDDHTAGVQVSLDGLTNDGNAQDQSADNIRADVERVFGTPGADLLRGSDRSDTLNGRDGDDRLEGLAGDDTLNGGPRGGILSADGSDVLDGGEGSDTATYADALATRVTLDGVADDGNTVIGAESDNVMTENVTGSSAGDILIGDGGSNRLLGRGGEDTIEGRGGPDIVEGGPESDALRGEAGDDLLLANDGVQDALDCGPDFDEAFFDLADIGRVLRPGAVPTLPAALGCEEQEGAPAGRLPNVTLARRMVRIDHRGRAHVALRCPRDSHRRCAGRLRLQRLGGPELGAARFVIRKGSRATVTVRLRRRFPRRGAAEILALERDVDGRPKVTLARVRLRPA